MTRRAGTLEEAGAVEKRIDQRVAWSGQGKLFCDLCGLRFVAGEACEEARFFGEGYDGDFGSGSCDHRHQ